MIATLIKYLIADKCIDVIFDNLISDLEPPLYEYEDLEVIEIDDELYLVDSDGDIVCSVLDYMIDYGMENGLVDMETDELFVYFLEVGEGLREVDPTYMKCIDAMRYKG